MITFSKLGQFGRLGNEMFEVAFLMGMSKKFGCGFCIPEWAGTYYFQGPFKIGHLENPITIKEKHHHYFPYSIDPNKNYDFQGYFQSPRYFDHCKGHIKQQFSFSEDLKTGLSQKYDTDSVAIHVRRGDYVNNKNYVNLGQGYYNRGMEYFKEKQWLFFSDDIQYVKSVYGGLKNAVFVDEGAYESLCLMSMCNKFIVANSSFSFWGAWLAHSQTVVRPKQFYSGELARRCSTKDYYPVGWKAI